MLGAVKAHTFPALAWPCGNRNPSREHITNHYNIMKTLHVVTGTGNGPTYAVINCGNYNNDGQYSMQVCETEPGDKEMLGIDSDEPLWLISDPNCHLHHTTYPDMLVGEVAASFDYEGVFIIRLA